MRARVMIAALGALSLIGAAPSVPGGDARWERPAGPLDTAGDLEAAAFFEQRIVDHIHYGQIHELLYRTDERLPGDIQTLLGENDSALYTGNYLAAQSFRYALARDNLEELAGLREARDRFQAGPGKGHGPPVPDDLDERIAFWEGQRDDARWRVDAMAGQYHVLTNISENWHENPDLRLGGKPPVDELSERGCDPDWSGASHADTSEDECDESLPEELVHDVEDGEYERDGYVDYGGGLVTGGTTPINEPQPGLLFRYCSPVDAPAAFNAGRNPRYNRLAADLPWDNDGDGVIEDGEAQHCIGATSRDAYAGTTFGLATALDLVGPDDPELSAQIAHDLMVMTDYAVRYYWTAPRSHGRVVVPEVWGGNTLDGSYQADMFFQVPLHRLNLVQVARRAAAIAGTPEQQARYEAIWAEELATQLPVLAFEMLVDDTDTHGGYYKYHLHHMTGFNLIRLEQDPVLRAEFMRGFGVMDTVTRSHVNAFYEALTYALTGEADRLDDAVVHHRQWLDYFANAESHGYLVRNSPRCGSEIECVPKHRREVVVDAAGNEVSADYAVYNDVLIEGEALVTGEDPGPGQLRAKDPLPVGVRYPADFMWQKDPTILDGGHNTPRYAAPGADFLTPYWMIRYYSEVVQPQLTPFDAPPTPGFR
ncbi:MAG TPA: hypothetical protein VGA69_12865 [Nitriliruptorales bacterium]